MPALILFRMIGSDWYGIRKLMPSDLGQHAVELGGGGRAGVTADHELFAAFVGGLDLGGQRHRERPWGSRLR